MTPSEFASQIKSKYPQYANMDDVELSNRMIEKYPQYKDQVSVGFSPKQMIKNIPSDAANVGLNIGTALTHPAETGIGLVRTAAGGLGALADKVVPGASDGLVTSQDEDAWDSMKNMMIKKYGSIDALKQTIQNHPVEFATDLSAVLGTSGGLLGKAGEVSKLPVLAKGGGMVSSAGELVNPINAARGAARLAGEYIAKPISEGIAGLSGLQQRSPGVLAAEFKDPSLILSPGKKAVSGMYEQAKTEPLPEGINEISKNIELVDSAKQLDKEGNLTPEIALEAKKALSNLEGRVPDPYFRSSMDILNKVEKPVFGTQDIAHQRALQAEAMRNFIPINKDGTPSLTRFVLAAGLGEGAKYAGGSPAYAAALSPYMQGATAGLLGTATNAAAPIAQLLIDHPELAATLNKSNQLGISGMINNIQKKGKK